MQRALLAGFLVAFAVSGCSRTEGPSLLNLDTDTGTPDEFSILPTKPLQDPPSLASLPPPTPGGANRADPTPQADAIAALGGRPELLNRSTGEAGVVAYATRLGVTPGIRQELAREDAAFRRDNNGRLLERLFNVNVYFEAYEEQQLDQRRELERFRSAGIRTPAAPPEILE